MPVFVGIARTFVYFYAVKLGLNSGEHGVWMVSEGVKNRMVEN